MDNRLLDFIGELPKSPEQQRVYEEVAKMGFIIRFTDKHLYFLLRRTMPDYIFNHINSILPISEVDLSEDGRDWVVYEYRDLEQQRISSFNYQVGTLVRF